MSDLSKERENAALVREFKREIYLQRERRQSIFRKDEYEPL